MKLCIAEKPSVAGDMLRGKKIVELLLTIGIGTILLSIIGLYNGYPLVYSDTGTYIYSGFDKFIPVDRPIIYGLFINLFSLKYSAWLVIIFQNFLTAFVIHEVLMMFIKDNDRFRQLYFSIILFLVALTGIGWYSNQLMPDFFAPILILVIFILIARRNSSLFSKITFVLILLTSLITHLSHLLIGSAIVIAIIICKGLLKTELKKISIKRIVLVSIVVFSSWIILPSINYLVEKEFILSKGSHVFLMAHLNDAGILKKFLDENCSKTEFKDNKLCQYKDSLPNDLASFIWSSNILENTGGWENSKEEYDEIIYATIKQPKYLFLNVYRSFFYGLIQLTNNEIGQGLSAYNEGSAPYGQIHWRFNDELNNYSNSRQNKWNGANLKFDSLNIFHLILILISMLFLLRLFTSPILSKIDSSTIVFLVFIVLSISINSFITAGLNAPCSRFQARVIWLLPFSIIILMIKNFEVIIKTIYNNQYLKWLDKK